MFFFSINLFGQVRSFGDIPKDVLCQLDKMGCTEELVLNNYEGTYLNLVFKENTNEFNFINKKVGFIYGGAKSNKKEYFDLEKDRLSRNDTPNRGTLYIFDEVQKEKTGGYDAAIVYWSKRLISEQDVINKLK